LIVVDNLRIGGIQRLAIDECYSLNKKGIKHLLVSLNVLEENNSIVKVDREFTEISQLNLRYLGKGKLRQLNELTKLMKQDFNLIVTHSATAALLLRIAVTLKMKKVNIVLYIHQLISLSSNKQALKRFIYFVFANKLFVSSIQFKLEIKSYLKSRWWGALFRKKIYFDRMGIYLDRVDNQAKSHVCSETMPHLIFSSRMTEWKGFQVFLNLSSKLNARNHKIIFEIAKMKNKQNDIHDLNKDDNHIFYSKSPVSFKYPLRSLHIYPTSYGDLIQYPQSIGMNVLELLALGVPSLISIEGFESWPELQKSVLIETCDWSNPIEVDNKMNKLFNVDQATARDESTKIRDSISIEKHVANLVSQMVSENKYKLFSRIK
jgi:glycosyltransferase involved in cell wall biosynthesis